MTVLTRERRPSGPTRWREDEQGWGRDRSDRDRGDRGWFERAGDEIASWFGDEDGDGRRGRPDGQRFGSHGDQDRQGWLGGAQSAERGRGSQRDHGDRWDRESGSERNESHPRWRDEGYRRPYTGRSAGRQDFGGGERDRGEQPYRPMTGDYGRSERGGMHDRHYGEWRARQVEQLDGL